MFWPKKNLPDLQGIPLSLNGFRVRLRPPVLSDYQDWTRVRAKNKAYLTPYEPLWHPQALSRDFFRRRVERQQKDWMQDRAYSFLIVNQKDGGLIGGVNINSVCRGAGQYGSLGYWIDEDLQGQGLMAESLRLIIDFSFDQIKLQRLNAACLPHNSRSINLLLKLGFSEEGFAEKYIQINGTREDHRLFGLNRPDA